MKSVIKSLLAVLALLSPFALAAADTEQPILTFKTVVGQMTGASSIHFSIGGTGGGYIDVDCGFGAVEYDLKDANFDSSTGTISATTVTCTVSGAGVVKVYGEADKIDYLDVEGCYISEIDMSKLVNLQIFNAKYNELRALDLTPLTKLQSVNVGNNPFTAASPFVVGANKPELTILNVSQIEYLDPNFNLSLYPSMASFEAFGCPTLTQCDPTGCPELMSLSIDVTPVASIDVSKNPKLVVLNVADTRITQLDVTKNPALTQLFCGHTAAAYKAYKLRNLDLSGNPELYYLFATDNDMESIDISKNPKLFDLSLAGNKLRTLDISNNKNLYNVNLRRNYFTYSTLPLNPGDWNEYYYEQKPYIVNRAYRVGEEIDFSAMMREGTETVGTLYRVNYDEQSAPFPVDPSLYTFAGGKLTVKAEMPDSVFMSFDNSLFSEYALSSSNFVVKSADTFGKPTQAIRFVPASGTDVQFTVGAISTGDPILVDWGNGSYSPVSVAGSGIADGAVVRGAMSGSYVAVLVPENVDITAFAFASKLNSLDISAAKLLRELSLTGTGLTTIDLSEHRCLKSIKLSGNSFNTFSTKGRNRYFVKTVLEELVASGNNIVTFEHDDFDNVRLLDLSNNRIEEFEFASATGTQEINVSGNRIATADLAKCEGLKKLNLSNNLVSSIILPEEGRINELNVSGNLLSLATLPETDAILGEYIYAPQLPISIPVKGPGTNLSAQHRTIGDATTQYHWYKQDGTSLSEGTDYSCTDGKIRFTPGVGKVYGKLTHAAFPQFTLDDAKALRTSVMEVAQMPSTPVASFTTAEDGQEIRMAFAAWGSNATYYIDWTGDQLEYKSYTLGETYKEFFENTKAGATVKMYAYAGTAPLKVFSISGAKLSGVDVSALTRLETLTVANGGLKEFKLPAGNTIFELNLTGNQLSSIDFGQHKLSTLSLAANKFSGTFDLSVQPSLGVVSLAQNEITKVNFNNEYLWYLDLSYNNLSDISFAKAPGIEQLSVAGNQFERINVNGLSRLMALILDRNRFTFATLPRPKDSYILYSYAYQPNLKVVPNGLTVDLSREALVEGVATTFRWFLDQPVQNEDSGEWSGEELIAGEEYSVKGGVTTFSQKFDRLVGLLVNEKYPKLPLLTEMMSVSGVDAVAAPKAMVSVDGGNIIVAAAEGTPVAVFGMDGRLVRAASGSCVLSGFVPGAYVVKAGATTVKVCL